MQNFKIENRVFPSASCIWEIVGINTMADEVGQEANSFNNRKRSALDHQESLGSRETSDCLIDESNRSEIL